MAHLCGLDAPARAAGGRPGPAGADRAPAVAHARPSPRTPTSRRCAPSGRARRQRAQPPQPGPYWAIDAGPLRIVGIDTGIVGAIDAEQAAWLRRVSLGSDRPKILVTGKPLIVNGQHAPRRASAAGDRRRRARPRAQLRDGDRRRHAQLPALPGARSPDGRVIHYVVSGGGGAYTHATHQIPKVDARGRGRGRVQVLSAAQRLARALLAALRRAARRRARLAGAHAGGGGDAAEPGARHGAHARVAGAARRARAAGAAGRCSRPRPGAASIASRRSSSTGTTRRSSSTSSASTPSPARLRVRCFGVSGCARASTEPPVEDEFTVPLPSQRLNSASAPAPSRAEPTPRAVQRRHGAGPRRARRTRRAAVQPRLEPARVAKAAAQLHPRAAEVELGRHLAALDPEAPGAGGPARAERRVRGVADDRPLRPLGERLQVVDLPREAELERRRPPAARGRRRPAPGRPCASRSRPPARPPSCGASR